MVTTNWRRRQLGRFHSPISPIDPVPGRMNQTPPAETPSPAIVLNRAIERVNVDGEHPSWSAMSPRVKPRAEGLSEPRVLTNLSPRGSGCYWLLGVVVGDGVAAGAGVWLKADFQIFQPSLPRV